MKRGVNVKKIVDASIRKTGKENESQSKSLDYKGSKIKECKRRIE